MTNKIFRLMIVIALPVLFSAVAKAGVLVTDQLVTPLMPHMKKYVSIPVPPTFDSNKPVWVVYQLVGVSAASHPEGEIVLDSSFEMVPTPMADTVAIFKARDLKVNKSSGALGNQLSVIAGERKPEELREMFGEEMYAAYEALNKQEGVYVSGNVTKTYDVKGSKGLLLSAGVTRAKGIQPVVINVVIGQGDIPEQYQGNSSLVIEKLIAAIISILIAVVWLIKRR